jgi:hypothetical protein
MAANESAPPTGIGEARQNQDVDNVARADNGGNATLEAALAYAARGWFVLPVKADKKPWLDSWGKEQTTDPDTIRTWWRRWPSAGVAIACKASGLVVVDIDEPDAWEALRGLEPESCGLVASTPSGGRHLFYAAPVEGYVRSRARWPGIDVKASGGEHGGYVVAPPAPGREWAIGDPLDEADLLPMPGWLAEQLVEQEHQAAPTSAVPMAPRRAGRASDYRLREVESALWWHDPSRKRNSGWLDTIFAVHAALDGDPRGSALVEEWSATTPHAGQYEPGKPTEEYHRASAPGPNDKRAKIDAGTLFSRPLKEGWTPPPIDKTELPPFLREMEEQRESAETQARQLAKSRPLPPGAIGTMLGIPVNARLEPVAEAAAPQPEYLVESWRDRMQRPPMEWIIDGWLPEQGIGFLAADPGAGKTFVALDLALRLVHGRPWFGRPVEPCSVVYFGGEGMAGIAGRLRAWEAQHRPTLQEAANRWFAVVDGIPPLRAHLWPTYRDAIRRMVDANGSAPGLVIVDTFSNALDDGDENDSKSVVPALKLLGRIAREYRCVVMACHHLRKAQNARGSVRPAGDVAPTVADLRGSGALLGNVDYVLLAAKTAKGAGTLVVGKTKEGQEPPPIPYELVGVETGARRRNGAPERSAIVIGAAAPATVADPVAEQGRRAQQARQARVACVVQVVREKEAGYFTGANQLFQHLRTVPGCGNRNDVLAALRDALAERLVEWDGTHRAQKLRVCVSPPTPPGIGDTTDTTCAQAVPAQVSAVSGYQSIPVDTVDTAAVVPGGPRGLVGTPDDGQAEQPKRRRRSARRQVAP